MNELQLELTRLIGKKESTFGCIVYIPETQRHDRKLKEGLGRIHFASDFGDYMWVCLDNNNYIPGFDSKKRNVEIIGHPATLSDLHRWMNENRYIWEQRDIDIKIFDPNEQLVPYDSSKDLLDQDEETLKQIISLIK